MEQYFAVYEEMKGFLAFDDRDVAHLQAIGPILAKHGPEITDSFYATLLQFPKTAAILEGRVDHLKATHKRWMMQLAGGEYGRPFFEQQFRIGVVHVNVGILPEFVESVMSILRRDGLNAIHAEMGQTDAADAHYKSYLKALDLALLTINCAYADERLDRMAKASGMSRKLIENLILTARKK